MAQENCLVYSDCDRPDDLRNSCKLDRAEVARAQVVKHLVISMWSSLLKAMPWAGTGCDQASRSSMRAQAEEAILRGAIAHRWYCEDGLFRRGNATRATAEHGVDPHWRG